MTSCTIYLIRHAQSAPIATVPNSQWSLSEKGHIQAKKLVNILTSLHLDKLYSSPFVRCLETIRPFALSRGLQVHEHHDLREINLVPHFIKNFDEIQRKAWSYFSFALQDCESSKACQQRVHCALTEIARSNMGKKIAISSHGNAIALFLNKLEPSFKYEKFKAIRNPDIFHIQYNGERFVWEKEFVMAGALSSITSSL